jgi:hypothetical protein
MLCAGSFPISPESGEFGVFDERVSLRRPDVRRRRYYTEGPSTFRPPTFQTAMGSALQVHLDGAGTYRSLERRVILLGLIGIG